jgi:hypothetical protein
MLIRNMKASQERLRKLAGIQHPDRFNVQGVFQKRRFLGMLITQKGADR